MKKAITILITFTFLVIFDCSANNKDTTLIVPSISLSSDHSLMIDMPVEDKIELEKTMKTMANVGEEEEENLFYFPEVDKALISPNSAMTTTVFVENDDMCDVIKASEDDPEAKKEEEEAKQAIDKAKLGGTYIDEGVDLTTLELPAYRFQDLGNLEAIIVINSLTIDQEGGKVGVYVGLKIPQKNLDCNGNRKNVTMIFGSENISFSKENGLGIGDLRLVNDVAFEIGKNKESFVVINKGEINGDGDVTSGTYVKFGCDGIEEFGLSGEVHFSRKIMLPLDEDGKVIPAGNGDKKKRVVAGIDQVTVQDWNDILITGIGFNHPFALAKYPKVSFTLQDANLDMSDRKNPSSLVFPTDYGDQPPAGLWRGVFIKKIGVTLPNAFKKKCDGVGFDFTPDNSNLKENKELLAANISVEDAISSYSWNDGIPANNRGPSPMDYEPPVAIQEDFSPPETQTCTISFMAENLLVDKTGVSGEFSISSAAPIYSGPLISKKWSWSIDEITVSILQSDFYTFTIEGDIVIPISDKKKPFAYKAGLETVPIPDTDETERRFVFNIKVEEKTNFPIWDAFDVDLEANSTLSMSINTSGDDFKATAVLFGKMSVGKGISSDARIPSLRFENLKLSTEDGASLDEGEIYLVGGGSKLMNFPIQISEIGLKSQNSMRWGIHLKMELNLMDQKDGGLSASGAFTIWGKRETNVIGAHEWVFDKLEMTGVNICINLPAFKGSGTLEKFEEHDVYGKGFYAAMDASILSKQSVTDYQCGNPEEGALNLQMMGIFGNKNGLRYFLVDGFASSDELSLPLAPTPFAINGFGGGAFYHMKPADYKDPAQPNNNGNNANNNNNNNNGTNSSNISSTIGVSTSGLIYEPDPNTLFGIKFSTSLILANEPSPFKGKLTCIVRFGSGMSLQNITFWGTGEYIISEEEEDDNNMVGNGGDAANSGEDDITERTKDLALSESEMQNKDTQNSQVVEPGKIKGKLGLSLDFDGGGSLHGYGNVVMSLSEGRITGHGTLDLLIDPDNEKFHLYIGGYRDNSIVVPSFFDPENSVEVLTPVTVLVDFGEELGLTAQAEVYFLIGNDIPGPPPIHPEAVRYFEIDPNANNHEKLTCGGNSPATGSGVAFGASLNFKLVQKVKIKLGFVRITILDLKVLGGVGFDIALLKYGIATSCVTGANDGGPHGIKGHRATGNIWAFVKVFGKAFGVPIMPGLGAGVYLGADIPNPSYFRAIAVIDLGKRFRFNLELGDECGFPCSVNNE